MASVPQVGDADRGARLFGARCAQCHTCSEGGRNKVGPSLYGLFGRTAGAVRSYEYSAVVKSSGIVWEDRTLFEFLESPKRYIPVTKMNFPGFRNPQDRADVIAHLEKISGPRSSELRVNRPRRGSSRLLVSGLVFGSAVAAVISQVAARLAPRSALSGQNKEVVFAGLVLGGAAVFAFVARGVDYAKAKAR